MPPKQPTDEELQNALDLVANHGTYHLAYKASGIPDGTLRRRCSIAKEKGFVANCDTLPGSTLLGPNGEIKLRWVKSEAKNNELKIAINRLMEECRDTLPKVKPVKFNKQKFDSNLVSVMPWGDPHFGLLCDPLETQEAFDTDIAERDLVQGVSYLSSQSPSSEKLIMINLGDFYHADSNRAETYSGTRLDVDSRLHRVIKAGVRAIRTCIAEGLKKHKHVEFITVQGNHDDTLAQFLAVALDVMYENEPRVTIHAQPTRRKYVKFGKVLIGAVHGDKQNENKLAGIMSTEQAKWWGETEHRVFFKGHLHHDRVTEYNGMRVEMVRTLAPKDEYAVSGGWLSKNDMKLITYYKEYGEGSRVS